MYSRRCELIEDSRARAHRSPSPHSSSSSLFSIFSLWWPTSRQLQHETSSSISYSQPGSLTTTSASLCYHLPRVYQLDTRAHGIILYCCSLRMRGRLNKPWYWLGLDFLLKKESVFYANFSTTAQDTLASPELVGWASCATLSCERVVQKNRDIDSGQISYFIRRACSTQTLV